MKTLKLSLALIIAVLTTGLTYVSKAGSMTTTRCFTIVTVTNGIAPTTLSIGVANCQTAESVVHDQGKIYLINASLPNSLENEVYYVPSNVSFCCVNLVEATPQDPNFLLSALLNLRDGSKRYTVTDVFCRPAV
ncbi:hypothetical protein ACFOTA_21660 [Chitinophaga sp. GCM10012297]|uniref:Uncharacterized protein n=1 Tax=Chitinophaga chungangae TaxID=2821488 RepID=A0ABS3YJH3_9BACT|nr:hypothetical protein [Chitinophaga chungangae]MBO9154836.1 hypothetical protein [Chitinophaga chungangae]